MSTEATIPFRKTRDLGDLISVTFVYLRQNVRLLGKSLLYILGPVLAVYLVVSTLFQDQFLALQQIEQTAEPGAVFSRLAAPLLLLAPVNLVVVVLTLCIVYGHMRLYRAHGPGGFAVADVWQATKRTFWPMLGTTLAVGLAFFAACVGVVLVAVLVGTVLAGAAGAVGGALGAVLAVVGFVCAAAYLMVFVALVFPVRAYEDVGVGEAFGRVRTLLEGFFWRSLGVVFVIFLLYYILAMAFSMPASILSFVWGFNAASGSAEASTLLRIALAATNALGTLGSALVYCIPLVAAGLYYFDLVERREHVGLAARVEQVGREEEERERGARGVAETESGWGREDEEKEETGNEERGSDQARWRPPGGRDA